jgi:hypothetical protein
MLKFTNHNVRDCRISCSLFTSPSSYFLENLITFETYDRLEEDELVI